MIALFLGYKKETVATKPLLLLLFDQCGQQQAEGASPPETTGASEAPTGDRKTANQGPVWATDSSECSISSIIIWGGE